MTLEELKAVNRYAESTRSLSYLPQVHERQTERMRTRSQWFLAPSVECTSCGGSLDLPLNEADVSVLTNALLRKSSSGTIGSEVVLLKLKLIVSICSGCCWSFLERRIHPEKTKHSSLEFQRQTSLFAQIS